MVRVERLKTNLHVIPARRRAPTAARASRTLREERRGGGAALSGVVPENERGAPRERLVLYRTTSVHTAAPAAVRCRDSSGDSRHSQVYQKFKLHSHPTAEDKAAAEAMLQKGLETRPSAYLQLLDPARRRCNSLWSSLKAGDATKSHF